MFDNQSACCFIDPTSLYLRCDLWDMKTPFILYDIVDDAGHVYGSNVHFPSRWRGVVNYGIETYFN